MSEEKHEEHGSGGHRGGGHGGGGHGGGGHEEHEGAPEWLISFADNVALLMGFFVIMLAMNMEKPKTGGLGGDNQNPSQQDMEMLDAVISIRQAFHNPVDMTSEDPNEAPLRNRIRERAEGRSQQAAESGESEEAQAIRPTDLTSLGGVVPFEDGEVTLTTSARKNAVALAGPLVGLRWVIEVRGHASPSEAFGDPEKSMGLSNRRAMAVAQALAAQGVSWQQIRLVACGDAERRIERSFDRAADAINQRVDVVVTHTPFEELPPASRATPPGR